MRKKEKELEYEYDVKLNKLRQQYRRNTNRLREIVNEAKKSKSNKILNKHEWDLLINENTRIQKEIDLLPVPNLRYPSPGPGQFVKRKSFLHKFNLQLYLFTYGGSEGCKKALGENWEYLMEWHEGIEPIFWEEYNWWNT